VSGRKKGSHFKKKRPQTNPVLAYFERFRRDQIIGMLLYADGAVGARNRVIADLREHLTDEHKEVLAQNPYEQLTEPAPERPAMETIASVRTDAAFGKETPEEPT
jgi:hypothetical protein